MSNTLSIHELEVQKNPEGKKLQYRIDGGIWRPIKKGSIIKVPVPWVGHIVLCTNDQNIGYRMSGGYTVALHNDGYAFVTNFDYNHCLECGTFLPEYVSAATFDIKSVANTCDKLWKLYRASFHPFCCEYEIPVMITDLIFNNGAIKCGSHTIENVREDSNKFVTRLKNLSNDKTKYVIISVDSKLKLSLGTEENSGIYTIKPNIPLVWKYGKYDDSVAYLDLDNSRNYHGDSSEGDSSEGETSDETESIKSQLLGLISVFTQDPLEADLVKRFVDEFVK